MSTSYNHKIRIAEKEYQLLSQQNMIKKVELEEMRLKQKLVDYVQTKEDLAEAIEVTKSEIKQLSEIRSEDEGGE